MEFNMITDRHNYDDGYIALVNINLENLPETIEIGEFKLLRKSEFHISLVCVKQLDEMFDADLIASRKDKLIQVFLNYEKSHGLTEFDRTGVFRLVKRGNKVTVVEIVDMPGIEELFNKFRSNGINIPTQPTHITLFTLQLDVGIGLTSQNQIENESKVVELTSIFVDQLK